MCFEILQDDEAFISSFDAEQIVQQFLDFGHCIFKMALGLYAIGKIALTNLNQVLNCFVLLKAIAVHVD
ncbi:hypothetical protein BS636_08895 [Acinetobacter sp. LoGeW2-3]|nr:hypothetical protein BS636_08895 [Acinetobacter sp. LoGeW2-3]